MAKFEIGNPGGPGRTKGSQNKDTHTVREIIEGILGMSAPQKLVELCGQDKAAQRQVISDLMPYMYRKLAPKEDAETIEARAKSDATLVENAMRALRLSVRASDESK
jgi:hypothetical protein